MVADNFRYPSIPDPTQDPASLQQSVIRIKEIVEMITGQRGPPEAKEYSLLEGLTQVQKSVGANSARIAELNEVVVNGDQSLAQRTTILEAAQAQTNNNYGSLSARITQVDTARVDGDVALAQHAQTLQATFTGQYNTLTAQVQHVDQARADGDSALAATTTRLDASVTDNATKVAIVQASVLQEAQARVTLSEALASTKTVLEARINENNQYTADVAAISFARIENEATVRATRDAALAEQANSLTTSLGGNTATLNFLSQSVNGISVKYGVTGYINGQTGGFVFTGVLKNDGSVAYGMEIWANVAINGDLLVTGTIRNRSIGNNSVSQVASMGTGSGKYAPPFLSMTVRGTGAVIVQAWTGTSGGVYSPDAGGRWIQLILDIWGPNGQRYSWGNPLFYVSNDLFQLPALSTLWVFGLSAGDYSFRVKLNDDSPIDQAVAMVIYELSK